MDQPLSSSGRKCASSAPSSISRRISFVSAVTVSGGGSARAALFALDRSEYVATHEAIPPTHSAASVSGSASSSLTHDASAASQSSSSPEDDDNDDDDDDEDLAGLSPPLLRFPEFAATSPRASPSSRDAQRYTSPPRRVTDA